MSEKDNTVNQDNSMDDILASIRKILADDEPETDEASEEIIDLQENDDRMVGKESAASFKGKTVEPAVDDELIDLAEEAVIPIGAKTSKDTPVDSNPSKHQTITESTPMEPQVLSPQTVKAANQALSKLNEVLHPGPSSVQSPNLSTGATLESLVQKALEPILKEWLDQNLPQVIENIVTKEIKKVIRHATDM